MTLELTTLSRRRSTRARRSAVHWASGLLMLIVLTFVLPAAVGLSSHTISDDAMSGTMGKGSAVIVESVPVADLEVGDVITFPRPSASRAGLVTRRIAAIDRGVFRTSGDGTGALDPWTVALADSTQDRVVAHVPYAGYVIDVLDGPVRSWVAGILVLLLATVTVSGVLAARREAHVAFDPAPTGGPAEAGVKLPAPRRMRNLRRNTHV